MAKKGRPFVYQSEEEKPITVSLRLPRDLAEQAKQYVKMHHPMTLTDLLLDGLRLRLDTPADPRDLLLSDDNTVIRELQEMVDAAVQRALVRESTAPPALKTSTLAPAPEVPAQPEPEKRHYDNTVLQEEAPRGRTPPGQYKLTPRQRASLRAKRQRGAPIKALMEEYRLSKASVFRYLKTPAR
jgi:hypothetical protein